MDLLLQDSTLINNFIDETEHAEALVICKKRFRRTYESYSNTTQPTKVLLEKVIHMYLFLGIEPSTKLMEDVKKFLLEGITFSKLDIYMHLPQYDQVVKLLHPEYYVEVDPRRFNQFTVSETIYNLALQEGYEIEDKYENAQSIWYIEYLRAKGIPIDYAAVEHLTMHGPWHCFTYIINIEDKPQPCYTDDEIEDSSSDDSTHDVPDGYTHNTNSTRPSAQTSTGKLDSRLIEYALKVSVWEDDMKAFKYLLTKVSRVAFVSELLNECKRPKMKRYIGPLAHCDVSDSHEIISKKDTRILEHMKDVCPKILKDLTPDFMRDGWIEGINFILNNVYVDLNMLYKAYAYDVNNLNLFYNAALIHTSLRDIINNAILKDDTAYLDQLYGFNPINLNDIIDVDCFIGTNMIDSCINKGYKITKKNVLKSIRSKHRNNQAAYLIKKYGKVHTSFVKAAIQHDRRDIVTIAVDAGCRWRDTYPGLALKCGLRNMCRWLIEKGCPVNVKTQGLSLEMYRLIRKKRSV